jgi:hypothetical protein
MASRMTELVLDARDRERLAAFWSAVLGWVVVDRYDGQVEIGPSDGETGTAPVMVFVPSTDEKPAKLRLHIDVRPTDRDHQAELARLVGLGATRADVGQAADTPWVVLADPEGNEFCLLHRVAG